jgi:hypothetical protein
MPYISAVPHHYFGSPLFLAQTPSFSAPTRVTSLCPVLGSRDPIFYDGLCPASSQTLKGKTLLGSYIGLPPYIIKSKKPAGTDIAVGKLLSQRYGFGKVTLKSVFLRLFCNI